MNSNVRPLVQRPKVLLFDLGGVLVDNVAFERLSAIPHLGMTEAQIKSKWLTSATVRSFELGASTPTSFAESFIGEWGLLVEPAQFLEEFAAWPKGFYPGAVELLGALRRQFRVACLSNSNPVHWERLGDGLKKHFAPALSSHLLKALKPDARCFERALQECGVPSHQVAFFDDSFENVIAARALGLQAHHVCGLAQVRGTLEESGWLQ